MKKNEEFQSVKLSGIITAAEWDDDNNITTFKLSTQDEEEYFIVHKSNGKKLLKFISKYVEVTGVVEKNEYGEKLIVPESYKVIREY